MVASLPMLDELTKVLARPRLQRVRRFAAAEADLYVVMIQAGADVVTPTGRLHMCRDATDDLLLETALLGRAKFLVSRDADVIRDIALIQALRERGVRIVTVEQFLRLVSPRNSRPLGVRDGGPVLAQARLAHFCLWLPCPSPPTEPP